MPELEHDRELIDRLARMHEGNAVAHVNRAAEQREEGVVPRTGWSQHQMLAASGFVIAASYWSLVEPSRAVADYRIATEIHRALGHSYWMVLALASASESDIVSVPLVIDDTRDPNPLTVAFAMIGNEVSNADGRGMRAELSTTIGGMPATAPSAGSGSRSITTSASPRRCEPPAPGETSTALSSKQRPTSFGLPRSFAVPAMTTFTG
jgi:hypothetical protein